MRKLCGLCFVLLLLPQTLSAIEISQLELDTLTADLETLTTLSEALQTRLIGVNSELSTASQKLAESQKSLAETRQSWTAYESVAEAALKAARAERDQARACAVATGIAGLVAVIVVLLVK